MKRVAQRQRESLARARGLGAARRARVIGPLVPSTSPDQVLQAMADTLDGRALARRWRRQPRLRRPSMRPPRRPSGGAGESAIEQHRVIVCTGSGGVGKTTTSAALGVAGAMLGRRVLVLTIDPARRLWTALGMAQGNDDVRVPGQRYPGELWAGTIDPLRIFAGYVLQHSPDRATADRLMANARCTAALHHAVGLRVHLAVEVARGRHEWPL